jgi:uncharacterized protein with von Willebrand factor type A (vWA) domain
MRLLCENTHINLIAVMDALEFAIDRHQRDPGHAASHLLDAMIQEQKEFEPDEPFELHSLRSQLHSDFFDAVQELTLLYDAAHEELTSRCREAFERTKHTLDPMVRQAEEQFWVATDMLRKAEGR